MYDYSVQWSEEDQVFLCKVNEFPSLATHGDDHASALEQMRELLSFVLEDLTHGGEKIPEPLSTKSYSGKFGVRVPVELHRNLAREASKQGVSLNQLILMKLSR